MKGIIYLASNLITGKQYVGQTTRTLEKRKSKHLQNSKTDLNNRFYQAIRKHGIDSFEWEILEEVDGDLDEREIYWIKEYNTLFEGYNMTIGGGTLYGHKHTEETKKKISESMKGISMKDIYIEKFGEEEGIKIYEKYCEKLRKTNGKGRKRIDLFIEKYGEEEGRRRYKDMIESMREKKKGNKLSEEHKKKISEGGKGIKRSEQFKEKLRNRVYTEEHRRKIGDAHRGKLVSEETREKISKIHKGLKHSEEAKKQIGLSQRGKKKPRKKAP
jgi:group I intron endonuclease